MQVSVPNKSGFGPADWFQTHNVPWSNLMWRHYAWIIWHYISAFGVMFAILSWAQECLILEAASTYKGWKGLLACGTGLALYWLLPHRMYYFFGDAAYSNAAPNQKDEWGVAAMAAFADAQGRKFTTTVVSGPQGHYRVAVPYPKLERPGVLPSWFEIQNVPYTYLYWRQWAWIIWHVLSGFGVMFAYLSWLQESEVLTNADDFKWRKGVLACGTGLVLYWLLPHRMYNFHDPEPLS